MSSRELSLMQHLQELRRRLFISVAAMLLGTIICFYFWEEIIMLLALPAQELNDGEGVQLIATQVTESLGTSFKVSLFGGFVLAFPVILYQAIRFVAPGLSSKEKISLLAFLPFCLGAFLAGIAFAYFVLTPQALPFLIDFGGDVVEPFIRVSSYVDVMVRLLFGMGFVFETPLVMFLLAQLGIVNARGFSRFRRFWIVLAFVIAALITPTVDPINQTMVAVPLLVLYEVGILLARLVGRKRRRSAEAIVPASEVE